jgi:MtN3 and saliva related transmembrane protein
MIMDGAFVEILGLIAGTLTTISFVPQLIKIVKSKSAKDVSLIMFLIFVVGIFLWLVYGILTKTLAIIVANSVTLILALSILFLKIKYDFKR